MRFHAFDLSLDVIRSLRRPVEVIRRHDRKNALEIREAASSVAKNLAEGNRRRGGDRIHLWTVAAGSADEVLAALRVAIAWGDLSEGIAEESLELLDRLLAILWRLTH